MSLNKDQYYTSGSSFSGKGNKEMLDAIKKHAFNPTKNFKSGNKAMLSPASKPTTALNYMAGGGDVPKETTGLFGQYGTKEFRGDREAIYGHDRKHARYLKRKYNKLIRDDYVDPETGEDFSQYARVKTRDFMPIGTGAPTFKDGGEVMELSDKEIEEYRKKGYVVIED